MRPVGKRLVIALGFVVALSVGPAGAETVATGGGASARAYAIRVVAPGQTGATAGYVAAPEDAVAFGPSFAYPEDGTGLTTGSLTASASASLATTAAANASAEVSSVVLFGGEVTIGHVGALATATAEPGSAVGDLARSSVSGIVTPGGGVEAAPGVRVPLGDWGFLTTLAQGSAPAEDGYRGFVTAVEISITVDHGGLPAGTQIQIGYAEVSVQAPTLAEAPPPPPPPQPTVKPGPKSPTAGPPRTRAPQPSAPPVRPTPAIEPRLTKGGYVFPVYGPASYVDTYGAARANVGWHHGEDIFAPMGAPVLAVARGTVFSVGWNDVGGNRFWLRDQFGNEFYYAHLSAFTPLAVNGGRVRAGDVIGFVGNTGDAETTPPHLHFEFHPVSLLGLGYDGVVNPFPYLNAWRRLEDVNLVAGASWIPVAAASSQAPPPGAILLHSTDISRATGLEPGSLRKALEAEDVAEQESLPAPEDEASDQPARVSDTR
jgi:murein DD-endopeptidase MepM/ murein hydrolase activator NlpD